MPPRIAARLKRPRKQGKSRGFWAIDSFEIERSSPLARLTLAQVEELRSSFRRFDANKSGELEGAEIKRALMMTGIARTPSELEHYLSLLDINGDRKVQEKEYLEFMAVEYLKTANYTDDLDKALEVVLKHCSLQRLQEMRKMPSSEVGAIAQMLVEQSPHRLRTRQALLDAWKGACARRRRPPSL